MDSKPQQLDSIDTYFVKTKQFVCHYFDALEKNHSSPAAATFPRDVSLLIDFYKQTGQVYLDYLKDNIELYAELLGDETLPSNDLVSGDRRFSLPTWHEHPYFKLIMKKYLLLNQYVDVLVDNAEQIDATHSKKIRFFAKQFLDAMSPTNFVLTNPEVINKTYQTNGQNLIDGFNAFLEDLKKSKDLFKMKMTDEEAFVVGENVANTEGEVIFENKLMQLIQYTPKTKTNYAIPLLVVPPWINKYYILDLNEKKSLVNWLLKEGFSVFMISWVNPGEKYADMDFEAYVNLGPLAALEVIKKQLNVKKINTLGFCIGGTLLATTVAYLAKVNRSNEINSVTYLATLMDFSAPGDIEIFIDDVQMYYLEEMMKEKGYLDGSFLAHSFNLLRAHDLIWSYFVKNYLLGELPVASDVLFWNGDSTNMPAKMHMTYLREFYVNNNFIKKNQFSINKTPLDISAIDCPSFFVSTIKDHITPWQSIYSGFNAHSGDKTFIVGQAGHIVGIINPPGKDKYGFFSNTNYVNDPNDWLKTAEFHQTSWWPTWSKWLKKYAGAKKEIVKQSAWPYKPIEKAPGRYVRVSLEDIRKQEE